MADQLPSDALFNIFSRLPVKSLARFRCVCKLWCKYINDPYLATLHDKLAMEEPMLLTHKGVNSDKMPRIHIISFSHIKFKPIFLMSLFSSLNILFNEARIDLEVRKNPDLKDSSYKGLSSRYQLPIDRFQSSCKGLLLFGSRYSYNMINLVVIHPLRKELYELPPIVMKVPGNAVSSGLGFDTSTNTFKVVCIMRKKKFGDFSKENLRTMVHVLGTNTWREIPQVPHYHLAFRRGVFVHGCLHWLSIYNQPSKNAIIFFDVTSEEFGIIYPPKQGVHVIHRALTNLGGELGYVLEEVNNSIEVWVLKNKTEWVMHCQFRNERHPRLIVLGCWNKDGDLLLTNAEWEDQLVVYNLKSGTLQKAGWISGDVTHIQMYRGSLFSIDGAYSIKAQRKSQELIRSEVATFNDGNSFFSTSRVLLSKWYKYASMGFYLLAKHQWEMKKRHGLKKGFTELTKFYVWGSNSSPPLRLLVIFSPLAMNVLLFSSCLLLTGTDSS